jgi:hypothetical protein
VAQPASTAGTVGNLISAVALASGGAKNTAAFLDLSNIIEGAVTCEMITGGTTVTKATVFSFFRVYAPNTGNAGSAPIHFTSGASAAATSIAVSSKTGISVGQTIMLNQASGNAGELVTVSAIAGTGPYTLTVSALQNAYSTNDYVYLVAQTASFSASPSSSTGTWVANDDYSTTLSIPTGWWGVQALNTDTAQGVTVNVTYDEIVKYQ